MEKDQSKTVEELDLVSQNLQVQKAQGSEMNYPITNSNGTCSAFETAILERFEELFACMDGEDAISETVSNLSTTSLIQRLTVFSSTTF